MEIELIKQLLIIFGVIAPVIIAVYMLIFLLRKRCPLCGAKMKFLYRGNSVVGYYCPKCKHYEVKVIE